MVKLFFLCLSVLFKKKLFKYFFALYLKKKKKIMVDKEIFFDLILLLDGFKNDLCCDISCLSLQRYLLDILIKK